jgi:hypothetical protein
VSYVTLYCFFRWRVYLITLFYTCRMIGAIDQSSNNHRNMNQVARKRKQSRSHTCIRECISTKLSSDVFIHLSFNDRILINEINRFEEFIDWSRSGSPWDTYKNVFQWICCLTMIESSQYAYESMKQNGRRTQLSLWRWN